MRREEEYVGKRVMVMGVLETRRQGSQKRRSDFSLPSLAKRRWTESTEDDLKLKCRQYPAIHTNYSCSNCTI